VADSPEKKDVENRARRGRLMARPVTAAAAEVKAELLMVTPYFIPSRDEIQLLDRLLEHGVRVGILTNSLQSAPGTLAQAGYMGYRRSLLENGADLYEIRALLGNRRGSGQTAHISSFGNYGLHAKLFVFDRERLFIGSMNYDQRSKHLNTEMGLIIDSPELAQQVAGRFDHMIEPENAYVVSMREIGPRRRFDLVWDTVQGGQAIEFTNEPARNWWQRFKFRFLTFVPADSEL